MSQLKLVEAEAETLTVRSDLLGELNVPASDALHFPTGMLGFPNVAASCWCVRATTDCSGSSP